MDKPNTASNKLHLIPEPSPSPNPSGPMVFHGMVGFTW
jgi:hypothetical protein